MTAGTLRRPGRAGKARKEAGVAALKAAGVSVRFDGLSALEDVDITLDQLNVLGLVGPNGAGKTTLVNVMSGYQRPTSGQLVLDDDAVTGLTPEALALRGVARTFQSVRLFRRLSVLENVEVAALARHARRARAREVARAALAFIDLEALSHRRAGALSYADERRVGIARALALQPRFLLLDEPAAGMTEAECEELARLITLIPQRYECGVLLIEHNISVVTSVCKDLHVLNNGRTLASGPIDAVRRDPEVVAAYFGTA